jgi:CHASE3 domain sensor protein
MDTEEIGRLLKASLDTQREHLAEYRRVTERSLDLQQRAVARQEQMVQVYRWLLVIGGGLVSILLMLLVYLLVRYSRPLFGI